jgi:hypothetical protein
VNQPNFFSKKKKLNRPTVMCIEWSTKGREFDMQLPLIYFFEKILGWNVEYKSAFNWPSIIKAVPDLILMSGVEGSKVGMEWARRIEKSKIPLFSQVTEGIFREENIEEFVFGHNKKKKHISQNMIMYWSFNSYLMAIKAFPKLKSKTRVSGAVGFDKYKLFKTKYIKKKNQKTKIIGYAAFDFNALIEDPRRINFRDIFINDVNNCSLILKDLALSLPDITFLVKPHPHDEGKIPLEVRELQNLNNIKIDFDISINDAIASSDIWLNYNSSTNLDAWLLDKPSITFLNDKKRIFSENNYGSVMENDSMKIKDLIIEFYNNGRIKRFDDLKEKRKKYIRRSIGYNDGMNHVRFMSFLKPYIESIEKGKQKKGVWKLSLMEKVKGYIKHLVYTLSYNRPWIPFIGRYSTFYKRFSLQELEKQKKKTFPKINIFYENNFDKIKYLYNNYSK